MKLMACRVEKEINTRRGGYKMRGGYFDGNAYSEHAVVENRRT